ncbi:transmembrane 26 [Brachionus plicatilis]|uniref:Transmembrane 26 n=1 Tax=Brachionus plicatilis TaxID=10195 RepID=A0A3M7PLC1_BRAPC|nr:transmembrane 26 [Brachionus plicatilis]
MKYTSTHRVFRALLARILCLVHIAFSIYFLYSVKKDFLYLLPIIGAILLIFETGIIVVIFQGKEPTRWFSTAFFIYVATIVPCYWLLELENIRKALTGTGVRDYMITRDQLMGDIVSNIKVVWSKVELQIFFALIIFIRWLIPKSSLTHYGLSELLFKYFAISCDMLDFLSILQDVTLIKIEYLVYWTLATWSWSTVQFFIFVPNYEDTEKNEFFAYITSSFLSTFFLDLPYLTVRIAAIFAFGSHNYNSYFFASKNILMILLQVFRIRATFLEREIRQNREARSLKDKPGFDKETKNLFDPNELARRNYLLKQQKMRNASYGVIEPKASYESLDNLGNTNRLPRNIEAVNYAKRTPLDRQRSPQKRDAIVIPDEAFNQRPPPIPAARQQGLNSIDETNKSLYSPRLDLSQTAHKNTQL